MRLKVYQAPNIGAAMAMVRDELGPDALIVANRDVDGGIELTVAQQEAPSAAPSTSADDDPLEQLQAVPPSTQRTVSPIDVARIGTLRWHGIPSDLATSLGRGNLADAVGAEFTFRLLPCRCGDRPLLLVGPPGAGKTLTAARLATRSKLAGQASMVITADGSRAGATEQLAAFTRLLGLPLIVADTPKQLARAVARRVDDEPVLVDMPGMNPFDPTDQAFLTECQAIIGAEIALVLPAGLDPADAEELATSYGKLGARFLVATRLDQSWRLGGVLAAASTGLALTEAGVSAAVANGLVPLTPEFLADRLVTARRPNAEGSAVTTSTSPLAGVARACGEQPRSST